jgi:hypothetical protein
MIACLFVKKKLEQFFFQNMKKKKKKRLCSNISVFPFLIAKF